MNLRGFDALVARQISDKAVPSISYVLFDRNEVLAQRHLTQEGELSAGVFRIGSLSKTFAALAAMRFVEQQVLALDADIAEVVPGFAPANPWGGGPVTLRKLLSHRSGLTREARHGGYLDDGNPPLAQTVAGLATSALKAPSDGTAYFYSNAGFAVIGRAIKLATGRTYAGALREIVLAPLGLDDTQIARTPEIERRLAPALMWTTEGDAPAPRFDLGSAPAGNIYATMEDIAGYGSALLRGSHGLVTPAALSQMWTAPIPGATYGLGFQLGDLDGHRTVGHGGALYGYSSSLILVPDAGIGLAMIATLDWSHELVGRLSCHALRLALAQRDHGEPPAPDAIEAPYGEPLSWRGHPPPPTPDESVSAPADVAPHLGTYAPAFMPTHLRWSAGRLVCIIETFSRHDCEPIGGGRYLMHGAMYGREVLELGAEDAHGRAAIRVGEVLLPRL